MKPIVVQVEGSVACDLERTCARFARIDLPSILRGHGPLPAVRRVEGQRGRWDSAGDTRVIVLEDGSRMREELLRVDWPHGFDYVVDSFTGPLRHLVVEMRGSWAFEAHPTLPGQTRARWRYAFHLRSALAKPLSLVVIRVFWKPLMQRALDAAARIAEAEPVGGGS